MRIAVVHSFYDSSQPSGENSVVRDQVWALRDAGHDVELIARETDVVQSERLYKLRSALTAATGLGPDTGPDLRAFAPDVVHVHNTFPNWGLAGLRRWAPRLVVTVHNFRAVCAAATLFRDGAPCTECLDTPVLPAVQHSCYRGSRLATLPLAIGTRPRGPVRSMLAEAAAVTVLNERARDVYQRELDRSVHVVPNFVEAPTTDAVSEPFGWAYVGRFSPEKGVLQMLHDWPSDQALDVIGSGPLESEVRAYAASKEAVAVLQPMSRVQLKRRLARYTGLVLPSLCAEGLPTVLLEALAVGTPAVVSSTVSAAPSLDDQGAVKRYDAAHGPGGLLRAMTAVQEAGKPMRARAIAAYRDNYSPEAWLRRITQVYNQVLENPFRMPRS